MKITCDICKKKKKGSVLDYGDGITRTRCDDCYEKDKSLKNYQSCEVYSRIVGYLRPINQWNIGKKQEFKERKEYDTTN